MPIEPKRRLEKELSNIDILVIKPSDEGSETKEQDLVDSIKNGSKGSNLLSIPEYSEKHNQLTPESGIGTDDGLPSFPHKEEDKQSTNFSVTGSEYSPKTLDYIQFLKEIQNFPDNLNQKNEEDEQSINFSTTDSDAFDSEDSYDSRDDPLHFNYQNKVEAEKTAISYVESVLQDDNNQETYTDSSSWNSEEDYLLPDDSFLMKLEIPLTESEEKFIYEFYQKMEEVEAENDRERKDNACNPNVNCTESALKRIKYLVDEYLQRGIRLNSPCNDSNGNTVTNLIFEKLIYVLDDIVRVTYNTTAYGQFKPYDVSSYDEDYDDEYELFKGSSSEIVSSIIGDLLIRGEKVKSSYFYYDRLAHVTRSIDYGLFEKCEEIESKLRNVAYKSVINKNKWKPDVGIDNCYFYIKYEKGSIVETTRIINSQTIEDLNSEYKLNLKVGILQVGGSVVRVERLEERRNYTDVPRGKIKMSFTVKIADKTEKISILLCSIGKITTK